MNKITNELGLKPAIAPLERPIRERKRPPAKVAGESKMARRMRRKARV